MGVSRHCVICVACCLLALGAAKKPPSLEPVKEVHSVRSQLAGYITEMLFSPDGSVLWTLDVEGVLRSYDAAKGTVQKTVPARKGLAKLLWIEGAGACVVVGGEKTAEAWSIEAQQRAALFPHDGSGGDVGTLVIAPDGSRAALASRTAVVLYDGRTGEPLGQVAVKDRAYSMAFSPDAKALAAMIGPKVLVWDVQTGKEIASIAVRSAGPVRWTSEKHLVIGSPVSLSVHDVSSGQNLLTVDTKEYGTAPAIACGAQGKVIALAASGGLYAWEWETGKQVASITGNMAPRAIAMSRDGKRLALMTLHQRFQLWDLEKVVPILDEQLPRPCSIAIAPDGRSFATLECAGVALWDGTTGKRRELCAFPSPRRPEDLGQLVYSGDGRVLGAGIRGGFAFWSASPLRQIALVDAESTAAAMRFTLLGGRPVLSPDGQRVLGLLADKPALVNVAELKLAVALPGAAGLRSGVFSPDGTTVYTLHGAKGDALAAWDSATGQPRYAVKTPPGLVLLRMDKAGKFLIAAGGDSTYIWQADTGKPLHLVKLAPTPACPFVLSPDASLVAIPRGGLPVHIHDLRTGDELLTLDGHDHRVRDVAFFPDGRRLLSCDDLGNLFLWDLRQ